MKQPQRHRAGIGQSSSPDRRTGANADQPSVSKELRITWDNNPTTSSYEPRRAGAIHPMTLIADDVKRIAHLARLALSDQESAELLTQLNGFFSNVERMRAVDTSGVEPLFTPLSAFEDARLRLREDAVTETDQRELNQRSAPAVDGGLFLVPRVVE
jgi:aspartyl-tRNA(Asn)/glutamyl-tRNA(Gln) amidotransferase subunit C